MFHAVIPDDWTLDGLPIRSMEPYFLQSRFAKSGGGKKFRKGKKRSHDQVSEDAEDEELEEETAPLRTRHQQIHAVPRGARQLALDV